HDAARRAAQSRLVQAPDLCAGLLYRIRREDAARRAREYRAEGLEARRGADRARRQGAGEHRRGDSGRHRGIDTGNTVGGAGRKPGFRQATHAVPRLVRVRLQVRKARAGPLGTRRPCSQCSKVRLLRPNNLANSPCDREIFSLIALTSMSSGTCTSQPWFSMPSANARACLALSIIRWPAVGFLFFISPSL